MVASPHSFIEAYEALRADTPRIAEREQALEDLRAAVSECLGDSVSLRLIGSVAAGIDSSDSDLDDPEVRSATHAMSL